MSLKIIQRMTRIGFILTPIALSGCYSFVHTFSFSTDINGKPISALQACLAQSHLQSPVPAGKTIETPHYTLITLQKNGEDIKAGEMCIIDKAKNTVEITAIDDLQFLPVALSGR
ncbi:hypothetical protein [Aquirhabdus parva]|nr:hypothetical protein [Aquirhabdus parva]